MSGAARCWAAVGLALCVGASACVAGTPLRSDERVRVSLPAHIHGKYGDHPARIMDMTNSGCCVSARGHK